MVDRYIFEEIIRSLNMNKVAILYGTRRVGKTTLLNKIVEHYKQQSLRCLQINCDSVRGRASLTTTDDQVLGDILKNVDLLAIDEAQNVENIGKTLKIIHDQFPEVRVIATGSSSFDLANKLGEPLVGRMRQFILYPFSVEELRRSEGAYNIDFRLEYFLKYGLYPCLYGLSGQDIEIELEQLVSGYLYKDLLTFDGIRNSKQIFRLLQCLALQVGSEVSFNELSSTVGLSANTVRKYIDLLEQCFVIFSLPAFSRNMRNELSGNRTRKVYFYDIGIRNLLVEDFRPINLRNDIGGVWENFCVVELIKKAQMEGRRSKFYFWRTMNGREIDLLEEYNSEFNVYEFKVSPKKKTGIPKEFQENYSVKSFDIINTENWNKYF